MCFDHIQHPTPSVSNFSTLFSMLTQFWNCSSQIPLCDESTLWLTTSECEACPVVWSIYHIIKENWLSLSQQLSNANGSLASCGTLCTLYPLHTVFSFFFFFWLEPDLLLCKLSVLLRVPMCSSPTDPPFLSYFLPLLALKNLSASSSLKYPMPCWGCMLCLPHLGVSTPQFVVLCILISRGFLYQLSTARRYLSIFLKWTFTQPWDSCALS